VETADRATEVDLVELERLWERAVAELDGQRGGWSLAGSLWRGDLARFLRSALAEEDRLLVLGRVDGRAVGLASLWADRGRREPLGQLELLYVEPDSRQAGVAAAMLAVVTSRCEEWGMAGLDAPALPGNRAAKSFFERQGMQARMLIMHKPLGGGPRA